LSLRSRRLMSLVASPEPVDLHHSRTALVTVLLARILSLGSFQSFCVAKSHIQGLSSQVFCFRPKKDNPHTCNSHKYDRIIRQGGRCVTHCLMILSYLRLLQVCGLSFSGMKQISRTLAELHWIRRHRPHDHTATCSSAAQDQRQAL